MRISALALCFLEARVLATPAQSTFPRGDSSTITNHATVTSPTSTYVTGSPQSSPNGPTSEIVDGRYTLSPLPDQCTDTFIPYQTTFWASGSQMNIDDAIGDSWWSSDSINWTFSTNTSGIGFTEPSWIERGHNPKLRIQPRTKASSFTLTTDPSGMSGFCSLRH